MKQQTIREISANAERRMGKALLLSLLLLPLWQLSAKAAFSGSGTEDDPICGTAESGSLLEPLQYVKNLTEGDGKTIRLLPLYEPKEYQLLFDANGGSFPDGSEEVEQTVFYNDGTAIFDVNGQKNGYLMENPNLITVPEDPKKEKHSFSGWYLKGNQIPKQNAGEKDGELIVTGSRYMIANDDETDLSKTEHTADGKTIAQAVWRKAEIEQKDGNEALLPETGGGHPTEDLWDERHRNNHVIEWLQDCPDMAAYSKAHGKTAYQYRRVILNAETAFAAEYRWFFKRAGEESFQRINCTEPYYVADRLTRENSGDSYRCEVLIGEKGASVCYETDISVYHLPVIEGTTVAVEGRVIGS